MAVKNITEVDVLNDIDIESAHIYVENNGEFHRADPDTVLKLLIARKGLVIPDESTGTSYKIGISDGRLFTEAVERGA